MADYILYNLNKHKQFKYVDKYKLDAPTDDLDILLGRLKRWYCWEETALCKSIIKDFRTGRLGRITLDKVRDY
jgi:hypothetical protein